MIFSNPLDLARQLTKTRYSARFAQSPDEVRAAQRLRFQVFNLELHEGLASSFATARDEDEFDAVCDHLIVVDDRSGEVVGTYRMQTGIMAARNLGYYSEREFDFSPYEAHRHAFVELGRACVHQDHRGIVVVGLLWKEIVRYVLANNARYMIGCSSLTSQDPILGVSMYRKLSEHHLAGPMFRTHPLREFALPDVPPLADCPPPPKLLRAYLGVGAKICGPPAIDREFKTIDFLTIMDSSNASVVATEHFLNRPRAGRP